MLDASACREILTALLSNWADRYASQDAVSIAALYSEDALFYGGTPELRRGRAGVEGYFAALPRMETRVTFSGLVASALAEDIIHSAMIATFHVPGRSLDMRLTQTYRNDGHEWLIVQHHASPSMALSAE